MTFKQFALIVFVSSALSLLSQTRYGINPPDSIRKKCDEIVAKEIGQTAFSNSVKFIKCDHTVTGDNEYYVIFYSFSVPNITESHVIFSLTYKKDASGAGVVKDAAFPSYTRLPLTLKTKAPKLVSYTEARKSAAAGDPVLRSNIDKLYGELSTEYDQKKKDYYFVWYYYYMQACSNCGNEPYKIHSAFVDATSGKLISKPKQEPK